MEIKGLLALLALHGGKIVSTASLQSNEINQARASDRMYVDENSLGFVWTPDICRLPETTEEVEFFEKWFPLHEPLPEKFQDVNFLFDKMYTDKHDVYGHCPHGENMVVCSICNPIN